MILVLQDYNKIFTNSYSHNIMGENDWYPMVKLQDGTILINYDSTYQDWRLALAYADYCSKALDAIEIGVSYYDTESTKWLHFEYEEIKEYESHNAVRLAELANERYFEDRGWMDTFEEEDRRWYGYRY